MSRRSDAIQAAGPTGRGRPVERELIPPVVLRAMLVLVLSALFIAGYARLTDRPLEALPASETGAAIVAERSILIDADGTTGAARVLGPDGSVLAQLDPSQGGFVAGVHRALSFERARRGVDAALPVRLVLYEGGQLSLRDDATGWRAELIGFGADNAAVFARLLD